MIKKAHWVGLALCVSATSSMAAACTSTKSLGGLGPPDIGLFGNSFSKVGSYVDCFTFSLGGPATSLGGVLEVDPLLNKLNIDVKSVSLFRADGTTMWQPDTSPLAFNFSGLLGGVVYTLQVASNVTSNWLGDSRDVGYAGKIVTLASAAPEPAAYALAIAGLAVVGVGVLRSRRR
jgi:hypothetical protein